MSGGPGSDTGLREGSLADIDLPRTYAGFFRSRATGVLHAVSDSRISEICFLGGRIADALSNLPEAETGAVLLRTGKVSAEHLQRARDTLEPGQQLGDRLVQLGYLSLEERTRAETERVQWIAANVLSWHDGTWRFHEVAPAREVAGLSIAPQDVVVRAACAHVAPGAALDELGGEDAVLTVSDEDLLALDGVEVPEEFDYLVTRLDGRRTLGEAIARAGASVTDVLPFLHALQAMGLLHRTDGAAQTREEGLPEAESPDEPSPPAPQDAPAEQDASPEPDFSEGSDRPPAPAALEAPGPLEIPTAGPAETHAPAADDQIRSAPSLVGEVMSRGTIVEVLFSLALLAAVFAGVLYMGRHYLAGLREDMDETRIVAHVPAASRGSRPNTDALPPGSAARVLSEVSFRYADAEPAVEEPEFDPHLRELLQADAYREALTEFQSGNYGQAAMLWTSGLDAYPEGSCTVLLSRACTPEEIRNQATTVGAGFLIVAEKTADSRCFHVVWGLFPDEEAALRALASARGGPQSVPTARVLRLEDLP